MKPLKALTLIVFKFEWFNGLRCPVRSLHLLHQWSATGAGRPFFSNWHIATQGFSKFKLELLKDVVFIDSDFCLVLSYLTKQNVLVLVVNFIFRFKTLILDKQLS